MMELILICMGICNVQRLMNDQYLDVQGVRVEEGVVAWSLRGRLWIAVDCSCTLFTGPAAAWCALILMQATKIGQQLTASLEFKSTAWWLPW